MLRSQRFDRKRMNRWNRFSKLPEKKRDRKFIDGLFINFNGLTVCELEIYSSFHYCNENGLARNEFHLHLNQIATGKIFRLIAITSNGLATDIWKQMKNNVSIENVSYFLEKNSMQCFVIIEYDWRNMATEFDVWTRMSTIENLTTSIHSKSHFFFFSIRPTTEPILRQEHTFIIQIHFEQKKRIDRQPTKRVCLPPNESLNSLVQPCLQPSRVEPIKP